MPGKGKAKGGDEKGAGKKVITPKEIWEGLTSAAKSAGREIGYRDGEPNPIYKMFDAYQEDKKDEMPTQIIISNEYEPVAMKVLCKALVTVQYEGIRMLRFWGVGFGDLGTKFIAEGLSGLPSVQCLEILDCLVGEKGCQELAKSLRRLSTTHLRNLKLDHNNIGTKGLTALTEGLQFNTILTSLSLGYCGIAADGGAPLAEWLSTKGIGIQKLNLEGNDLGHSGVTDLAQGLKCCETLTDLDLSLNKFDFKRKTMLALTGAFKENLPLVKINLDGNLIGNDGCKFLLERLADCTHITSLEITPFVDPVHLQMLFEWLDNNRNAGGGGKKKGKGSKKGSKKKGKKKK